MKTRFRNIVIQRNTKKKRVFKPSQLKVFGSPGSRLNPHRFIRVYKRKGAANAAPFSSNFLSLS
jgi:hypothetical protein